MGFFETALGGAAGPQMALFAGQEGMQAGLNYYSQQQTNQMMQENMRSQMAYGVNMSNTAHQREVEDLKAAGINPIYTAGGSGSSTPSSGLPSLEAPQLSMPSMFSTIMDYSLKAHQVDQGDRALQIQDKKTDAEIVKTLSDTELNKLKKILMQKGMPEAMLHGEAAGMLKKGLDWLKGNINRPKVPVPSSGGEMKQP